jgi:crotonobetainyl-CoA:carnitine CoA-transferase CaiB-like acyl-CoA transferase
VASLLGNSILDYTLGRAAKPEAAPHGAYRCRGGDRWCAISVRTDEEWQKFKQALGNPQWAEDEKFATIPTRLGNKAELDRLVEGWTKEHTAEETMNLLQSHGIAAGAVQDARDLANDPQLKARGFFTEVDKTVSDTSPIKLSETPARYTKAAPAKGEDNDYVYRRLLNMSEEEIYKLRQDGIM